VQAVFPDVNWERLYGGRVGLLMQFGDRLTITPGVMYQRITQGGPDTIDNPPGTQYAHYQPFDIPEPSEDNFSIYSLVVKYHFDQFDLTSASSKWNRHDRQQQDIAETMQILFDFPGYSIADGGVGPGAQHITDLSSQATEEIRLASNGTGRFQWLVGLFYSNYQSNTESYSIYPGFADYFGTSDLINEGEPLKIIQRAVFGESSYKVTDQLTATVGLRWYDYGSSVETVNSGLASIAGGPGTILEFGSANYSGYNPKVNLAYTLNDDVLLYTTAAKGFRPGGPNLPVPLAGPVQCLTGPGNLESLGLTSAPTQFNPDGVWSYEVGEKARLLDRHLVINGDVYYELWTDVQQLVDPSCGFSFTANAGAASVYGSEIEVAANITPAWTLTENLGYTHATFNQSVRATETVAGAKVLDVPDFTDSTSIIYTHPISSDYNLIARATYTYVGPMQDITYVRNYLAGYSLVGLRLGAVGDKLSAFAFASNVANKMAILTNSIATTVNVPQFNRQVTSQPRTIGIDVQYRY
jgi:iron complex outermembrane recepter protein